jgi:hypothetical protein
MATKQEKSFENEWIIYSNPVYWEVIVSAILSKKCTPISLYSWKIVDKKQILRTVSNDGVYCSSDQVGTVYLV